jgi:hypothetical protein
MVRRSFFLPIDVGMVELDRLVVYQKQINLEYIKKIKNRMGSAPSEDAMFQLCLPLDHPQPEVRKMRTHQNAYTFISQSNDLRFLEPVILESTQIIGHQSGGPIAGVLGLVVGFSVNYFSVLHVENRLILLNGSHRAFALRELGITHAPCLIITLSRREELNPLNIPDLQNKPDLYLKAPRPPLLKDYFDPMLRKLVKVPRKLRHVTVSFGVQPTDVPAMQTI